MAMRVGSSPWSSSWASLVDDSLIGRSVAAVEQQTPAVEVARMARQAEDEQIRDLYGLTDEEIKIVEEAVSE